MTDSLVAEKGERTSARVGHRSGYRTRTLVPRAGRLELRVPQARDGRFLTELFERCQRFGAGLGGDAGRDGCAGRLDPQGEGD